jgi:hypothetical protein
MGRRGWLGMGADSRAGARGTKGFRVAGACMLVVFAIGASMAASVAADEPTGESPQYFSCIKTEKVGKAYSGEYTERECKTKASPPMTGKYELREVESGTFETTGKGATLITRSTKGVAESIACKVGKSRGEFIDSDVYATDKLTFEKCRSNGEKSDPCGNVGAEAIETKPLFSALAWLNRGKAEAGILLEGEGEQVAKFKCGTEQVNLEGYLVGAIEDTRKGDTITFAVNARDEQARRSIWMFGAEIVSLALYTQQGASQIESTLETVEAQSGTGVY